MSMTDEEIIRYLEKHHFHDTAKEESFDRSKAASCINLSYVNSRKERVAAQRKQVAKRVGIFAGLALSVLVCVNGVKSYVSATDDKEVAASEDKNIFEGISDFLSTAINGGELNMNTLGRKLGALARKPNNEGELVYMEQSILSQCIIDLGNGKYGYDFDKIGQSIARLDRDLQDYAVCTVLYDEKMRGTLDNQIYVDENKTESNADLTIKAVAKWSNDEDIKAKYNKSFEQFLKDAKYESFDPYKKSQDDNAPTIKAIVDSLIERGYKR